MLAFGHRSSAEASLYSDPLKRVQNQTGFVEINFLLAGNVNISFCFLNYYTLALVSCSDSIAKHQSNFHALTVTKFIPEKRYDMEYFVHILNFFY